MNTALLFCMCFVGLCDCVSVMCVLYLESSAAPETKAYWLHQPAGKQEGQVSTADHVNRFFVIKKHVGPNINCPDNCAMMILWVKIQFCVQTWGDPVTQ